MKRIHVFSTAFFALLSFSALCLAENWTPELQREYEMKYDNLKILQSAEMKTDTSDEFITIPEGYKEVKDFDVAKTAPSIDFAVIQGMTPLYLPTFDLVKGGLYGGWGDVTRGPDKCFYFSIGNHMSYGGTAYIIKYDPAKKKQSIVLDLKKIVGWKPADFADGKLHGSLDIGPDGDMWMLSYYGPIPTKEDLSTVYKGSYLLKYNVFTQKTENLGIPLEGESWPYHVYDSKRGLFFGIGSVNGDVLVYDTKARKMLYGGFPSNDIHWCERCIMLDRDTGKIYSTNSKMYPPDPWPNMFKGDQNFVCYERRNNRFTVMNAKVPPNPVTGMVTGCRAHTEEKDAQGAFWCFDFSGGIFKFYPEEDRTESVGVNWGKEGKYTANMNFSPKKRYIYYLPGADNAAFTYGNPIVQYDTQTGKKKVIAFINNFYVKKYGYNPGGTYGIELDEKGESIFFYTNGRFATKEIGAAYGRPAIFHVHIPASERVE
ncbi:MAG: hypothetical protein WCU00_04630 [Candidatus Latescibacterota bacterium]|jgi:hypothetical protein